MSSSRTILASLKISLTAFAKRIHHTSVQSAAPQNLTVPISKKASVSTSVIKDGKAYPVARHVSPEELAELIKNAVPQEQIDSSLEQSIENHRRSVYG